MVREDLGSILSAEVDGLGVGRTREDLTLVGEGRTAEILSWDEGRVVRLFREEASRAYAQRELGVSRAVHDAGLPSPAVFLAETEDGLVEIDGRFGITMEYIRGPSMLEEVTRRPWRLRSAARTFARIHLLIHACGDATLPSQRERLHLTVERIAKLVGEDVAERILRTLQGLPDGQAVCHGDFHPDNMLMGSEGPVVIDWGPATVGNPAGDVAWTAYLFRHAALPPGTTWACRLLANLIRRLFLRLYLRDYLRESEIRRDEIERWSVPMAALRLGDGIPEEQELLLRIIRRGLGLAEAEGEIG